MQLTVSIPNLSTLIERLGQAPDIAAPILARTLRASVNVLQANTIKGIVPWRTGNLVRTFDQNISDTMAVYFPTASYAAFVEFGTAPHLILPKKGEALMWPGAWHPVRVVNHPGTAPNPYLERILSYSTDDIGALFATALTQIVEEMAS